ncbi:SPFH domain-containing protein [Pseudomonas taiwanensis]|uniref:SPFH domain-containing protein n=1 Tax=Pseudomonas taiwanensis TaxID=470150 RepID=UPI0028E039AD|nr:SPFH domain-containing protein [Pseudomonas taiwanensis]MDT8925098.1 SPFH domain-containing protein [Pseudomonas taiwanensis]
MSISQTIQKPQVTILPGAVAILIILANLAMACWLPHVITQPASYGNSTRILNGDIFDWMIIPLVFFNIFMTMGFAIIEPKEARVLLFFGKFSGVMMDNGFFWINPLASTRKVSLKIENFESEQIKVNDKTGSPIMAAAVVSTQVVDPEAYTFNADDTEALVMNAIDRVLRKTVSLYAYDISGSHDANEEGDVCLRDDSEEISARFKEEIQLIVSKIGMEVLDANFTNLSYAPEIAGVMLQRQQASALMDSRKILVASTVTVVKDAIKSMESTTNGQESIKMDEKTKAELAANLLTVMVSERGAQVTLPLS